MVDGSRRDILDVAEQELRTMDLLRLNWRSSNSTFEAPPGSQDMSGYCSPALNMAINLFQRIARQPARVSVQHARFFQVH